MVATDNSLPEIKKYVRQQVVTEPVGLEPPSKGDRLPTLQLKVFHEGQSMALSDAMRHRPSGVHSCKKPTATGLDQIALQLRPCLHQMADRAALRPRPSPGPDPTANAANRATPAQRASCFPQASLSKGRAVVNNVLPATQVSTWRCSATRST